MLPQPQTDAVPVYAPLGSASFNRWMHLRLEDLARDVEQALGPELIGLVLAGGYGRGEGGVVGAADREQPYNDLDLVIVQKSRRTHPALAGIARRHHARLGIDVDFSRPLTPVDLGAMEHRLMWFDMLHGHRVLRGPADLITGNVPAQLAGPPPLVEASRLLLNRGAGLIWAHRVHHRLAPAPDPDFCRRNLQKALLAVGDAQLIAAGAYRTAGAGKAATLRRLAVEGLVPATARTLALYERALAFKLAPDSAPRPSAPDAGWHEVTALWGKTFAWVEERRLGRRFADLDDYARWPGLREPEEHRTARLPRNVWVNLRRGRLSWTYPREELYRDVAIVLGLTRPGATLADSFAQRWLALWQRFN